MTADHDNHDAPEDGVVNRIIQIGLLVVVFSALNRILLRPWVLSPEAYGDPVIFFSTISGLFSAELRSVTVLLIVGIFTFRYRLSLTQWREFDHGKLLRVLAVTSAFIVTWVYSTYDFNHYFGQSHLVDRGLLWVMFGLVVWRPMFIFPLLVVTWPIAGQFQIPLAGYSWTIINLPARILLLIATTQLISLVTAKWKTQHFWFVLLCLIAGHYFPSGWGKVRIGWLQHDQIYFLLPNTYANGWLGFLEPSQIEELTRTLAWFNWPMKIGTLIIELGAVVFLWHRRISQTLLVAWAGFHVGIVCVSGIFLWPWIVLDLIVVWLIRRLRLVFSHMEVAFSIILISTAFIWVDAVGLVWIDSPVTNTYRVTATGESGQKYSVSQSVIAPYDYQFSLCSFAYLSDQPTVSVTWGATRLPTYLALRDAKSMSEVMEIEKRIGKSQFNQEQSNNMRMFLTTFATDLNREDNPTEFPWILCAPKTILHSRPDDEYQHQETIVSIEITRTLTGMIAGRYQESDPMPILTTERIGSDL